MMNSLGLVWNWLANEPHQRKGLRALQLCLGLMLLFRASTEARFAPFLWGPHGIGEGSSAQLLTLSLVPFADQIFSNNIGPIALVILMAGAAICLVLGIGTRWAVAVALITSAFLAARLPELGDGGDNVARLVLTYMLFALPHGSSPLRGSLAVWFHNIAMLAIGAQVTVLYLTSGFLKATGEKWNNGTAMYLISQVEWFSHPALRTWFHNPYITTASSYAAMFFMIWFPIAMVSWLRPIWLCIGISLHLGIAAFMGLICFSLAMIGLELFLVTDAEYTRIGRWFVTAWQRAGRTALSPGPSAVAFVDERCNGSYELSANKKMGPPP